MLGNKNQKEVTCVTGNGIFQRQHSASSTQDSHCPSLPPRPSHGHLRRVSGEQLHADRQNGNGLGAERDPPSSFALAAGMTAVLAANAGTLGGPEGSPEKVGLVVS